MKKIQKLSEQELLEKVIANESDAFNELYERYKNLVYYIAYEFVKSDADAKDVLQETFIQVYKSLPNLRDIDLFKPWISRITVSKCKNLFRRNHYQTMDDEHPLVKSQLQEYRSYMLPDKEMKYISDQELMYSFILQLPDSQKSVVVFHYFQQLSLQEVAYVLDIPLGTVKSRLSYAKASLKTCIEKYEERNNITLNFHADATIISLACLFGFKKVTAGMSTTKHANNVHWKMFLGGTTAKLLAGSIIIVSASMGALIMQKQNTTLNQPAQNTGTETNTYAKTNYFKLVKWASDYNDMETKTEKEFLDILPTYEALKDVKGDYYQRLVDDKWVEGFESFMK